LTLEQMPQFYFRPANFKMGTTDGNETGIPIPLMGVKIGGGFGECAVPVLFQDLFGRFKERVFIHVTLFLVVF